MEEMVISIGSKIVGLKNNGYAKTNDDCLMEVTDISPNNSMLDAKIIAHRNPSFKKTVGEEIQNLRAKSFRLATEGEIAEFTAKPTSTKAKLSGTYELKGGLKIRTFKDDTRIESTFNSTRELRTEFEPERVEGLKKLVETLKDVKKSDLKSFKLIKFAKENDFMKPFESLWDDKAMEAAVDNCINFFKEFQFSPNFRFLNTLSWKCQNNPEEGKEYIKQYFKVTDNPYATSVEDKLKSPEFDSIMNTLGLAEPTTVVNNRLTIYYGAPGTGKTTRAMKETSNRCIVCNNSILPQDLLEDFAFEDGKPGFKKSILRECLTEGKSLVLDEFNLLPFESLRFLQGILDGKKEFTYKGETITIADSFKIYATLNLAVNGITYAIPEPLVDRAGEIVEFTLTAKDLLSAIC